MLFWSLVVLAIAMVLAVAFALRGFNREMSRDKVGETTSEKEDVSHQMSDTSNQQQTNDPSADASEAEVQATVSIHSPALVLRDGVLSVSFELSNREGAQSGIRYGIRLMKQGTGKDYFIVADSYFSGETISLSEYQSVNRTIQYTPRSLDGSYTVFVEAATQNGLPLSRMPAGEVTLQSTSPSVFVDPESCFVGISGEDDQYMLSQGIDISSGEDLRVTCDVVAHLAAAGSSVTFIPQFETHRRNLFGELADDAETGISSSYTLHNGERKTLSFSVPHLKLPQAYSSNFTLVDSVNRDGVLSNGIELHYVIRGASGTIQSASLDRDSYKTGESAKVLVFITSSADRFYGSRAEGTNTGPLSLHVSIQDGRGVACSGPIAQGVSDGDMRTMIPVPIERDCSDPKIVATLLGESGQLDAQTFSVATAPSSEGNFNNTADAALSRSSFEGRGIADGWFWSKSIMTVIIVVLGGILLLLLLRKRSRSHSSIGVVAFLCLSNVLVCVSDVNADTFTVPGGNFVESTGSVQYMPPVTFDVSLDKSVYAPGETIKMSGSSTLPACSNGAASTGLFPLHRASYYPSGPFVQFTDSDSTGGVYNSVKGGIGTLGKYLIVQSDPPGYISRSMETSAPGSTGNYVIRFQGETVIDSVYHDIPFTVSDAINASCGGNSMEYPYLATPSWPAEFCATGTLSGSAPTFPSPGMSVSWKCSGLAGGNDISCSANRLDSELATPVIVPSCGAYGDSIELSYAVPTATSYSLRIDEDPSSWSGTCSTVNSGDTCLSTTFGTYSRDIVPGKTYDAWVHAYRSSDNSRKDSAHVSFSCPAPVVTGRLYINESNGVKIGMSNVSIFTCNSNPMTVTDSNGNFSFPVLKYSGIYAYCVRPQGVDLATLGLNAPTTPANYPPNQSVGTYEFQRVKKTIGSAFCASNPTGSGCTMVDTNGNVVADPWKSQDLAIDSGIDFKYTRLQPSLVVCPSPTASIALGQTRSDFKAWYRPSSATAVTCSNLTASDQNVTNSASWSSVEPSKVEVVGKGSLRGVDATPSGSYVTVTATYSAISATTQVEVVCAEDPTCGGVRENTCTDDQCLDSCGKTYYGTKDCREHWQEVAP